MQQIISASIKVVICSKKKPGHQQLCCGLNISYLSNSATVICVEGSDDVLSTLCSSCKWVGSGGHFASDTVAAIMWLREEDCWINSEIFGWPFIFRQC